MTPPLIILKPHKEESILRFHPWVFSGAIAKIVLDKQYPYAEPQEGEIVKVADFTGKILAVGHWQIGSIAVRILAFGTDNLPESFWHDRIQAAWQLRQSLGLVRDDNNMFRLIHGEGDFIPGLVVDVYADTAVVQAHSVGIHRHRQEIAKAIMDNVPVVKQIYYKSDDTLPHKAYIDGEKTGYLVGQTPKGECWAKENGLEFRIDWLQGQKTGFFVDQRDNRALLEHYAASRRVLNMFCYTGGFSVFALRGGATHVTSVDVSAKAIELVNSNVKRNFPDTDRHDAYACDAFDFLDKQTDNTPYDLIILDPPAFAKHRDAITNALRGYRRLNLKAFEKIAHGGILFTFSCSQAIDKDMFRQAVFTAAAQAKRNVRILHQLHQPADHPVNIFHLEGEYLKGLVLYVE